jgi:hypothetical protein
MSEIYLHPMMEVLQSNRGHVTTIFGILPAVTLSSGEVFFLTGYFYFIFRSLV